MFVSTMLLFTRETVASIKVYVEWQLVFMPHVAVMWP